MRNAVSLLLLCAIIGFIVSGLSYAFMDPPPLRLDGVLSFERGSMPMLFSFDAENLKRVYLHLTLLRPTGALSWALLILVWGGLVVYGAVTLIEMFSRRTDVDMVLDQAPLIAGLVIGAMWPWLGMTTPNTAFLMCVAAFAAVIFVTIRGQRFKGHIYTATSLGIFSGWFSVVVFITFATLLSTRLSVPLALSTMLGMVLLCVAGTIIQLQMTGNAAYTLTIILSLITLAVATITIAPIVAIIAVLGIAAMTFVLVRVTT